MGIGRARYVRRARLALLALLFLAALLALTLLFIHYRLSDLTASVQEDLLARVGFPLRVGAVEVDGLRGVLLRNVQATIKMGDGARMVVNAPVCRIEINLLALARGQVRADSVHVERARIILSVPEDLPVGEAAKETGFNLGTALESLPGLPPFSFRLTGAGCAVDVRGLPGGHRVGLGDVAFDAACLPGASQLSGILSANWEGDPGKPVRIALSYAAQDDFDATLRVDHMTAAGLNALVGRRDPLLDSGAISTVLRIGRHTAEHVNMQIEAHLREVQLPEHPHLIQPLTGAFTAIADYELAADTLRVVTAKADFTQFTGNLSGSVTFAGGEPEFALQMHAADVPLTRLLEEFIPENLAGAGALEMTLDAPSEFRGTLGGTARSPDIALSARLAGGHFAFSPASTALPAIQLTLGATAITWSAAAGFGDASAQILDGVMTHAGSGFTAQQVSGALRFSEAQITLDPLNVSVTGNPFVGRLYYDLTQQQGTFDLNGVLANLESTILAHPEPKTELAGSLAIRCRGALSASGYQLDLALDATQAHIQHDWFLDKRPGMGATFKGVSVNIRPREAVEIMGTLDLASAQTSFAADLDYHQGAYRLTRIRGRAEPFDVGLLNQVLRFPYAITGGQLLAGYLDWSRPNDRPEASMVEFGGELPEARFLPESGSEPLQVRDARFSVRLDSSDPGARTGAISVEAGLASLPPFGEPWFIPLRTDPELIAKFPEVPREMTLALNAAEIAAPPWAAREFTARGGFNADEMHLSHFSALVGAAGRISGEYHLEKQENVVSVTAHWQDAPAEPILWHMKLPGLMQARTTGAMEYEIDLDDPNTLQGRGDLHFYEGRFSADYLFDRLGNILADDTSALPPSLRFSQLDFALLLDGDVITTDNLRLGLEGITITGQGQFITGADMNYTLKAAIAPETAARMPVFQSYFNVEGHRVSQNDIELTFHVAGPVFQPTSSVVGLPSIGVTVVSGAAELGSEALRIIDTPRQVLLDLFRIGGAIISSGG